MGKGKTELERRPAVLECVYSPGDLLANIFSPGGTSQNLTILTGPRGSGKTSWCLSLHQESIRLGIQSQGLISNPVVEKSQKVGIELFDLSRHLSYPLATRRRNRKKKILTQGWEFDYKTLCWGNEIISRIGKTPLLIIDELGPLEFNGRGGWQAAFSLLDKREYRWAIVVIRPTLLAIAKRLWPWGKVLDIGKGIL